MRPRIKIRGAVGMGVWRRMGCVWSARWLRLFILIQDEADRSYQEQHNFQGCVL